MVFFFSIFPQWRCLVRQNCTFDIIVLQYLLYNTVKTISSSSHLFTQKKKESLDLCNAAPPKDHFLLGLHFPEVPGSALGEGGGGGCAKVVEGGGVCTLRSLN